MQRKRSALSSRACFWSGKPGLTPTTLPGQGCKAKGAQRTWVDFGWSYLVPVPLLTSVSLVMEGRVKGTYLLEESRRRRVRVGNRTPLGAFWPVLYSSTQTPPATQFFLQTECTVHTFLVTSEKRSSKYAVMRSPLEGCDFRFDELFHSLLHSKFSLCSSGIC